MHLYFSLLSVLVIAVITNLNNYATSSVWVNAVTFLTALSLSLSLCIGYHCHISSSLGS